MNDCRPQNKSRAFTFIELLAVLAVLALLALVIFPVRGDLQNRAGRLQCANNLRQLGAGCMAYAGEYNEWLPILKLGAANAGQNQVNNIGALFYTRYLYLDPNGQDGIRISTNDTPANFQNLGYLYLTRLVQNPQIFYCPDYWNSTLFVGENYYQPLLTTHTSGAARSSYAFNPRIVNPNSGGFNNARRYQKLSQMESHKLFAIDYFQSSSPAAIASLSVAGTPHEREPGWNVLFTDGSVQFSQSEFALKNLSLFTFDENQVSALRQDTFYNYVEQDHPGDAP